MAKSKRKLIQLASTFLANGYWLGFKNGTIYKGSLKSICYPGLNCYSCPGALTSCPIGALQSLAAGRKFSFSFYVFGFIMLIGLFTGRLVCGFLCPFGFFQELLYRIPSNKIKLPRILNYFKYLFLIFFVLLLPALAVNEFGFGTQYFCKYLCPAGTLEAGLPIVLLNGNIRASLGWLFSWKLAVLIAVIVLAVVSKRPFCRIMCPLGALYSLFNPISFYRLEVVHESCISCNKCESVCPVGIRVYENPNSFECIRCGECIKVCPTNAIRRNGNEKNIGFDNCGVHSHRCQRLCEGCKPAAGGSE